LGTSNKEVIFGYIQSVWSVGISPTEMAAGYLRITFHHSRKTWRWLTKWQRSCDITLKQFAFHNGENPLQTTNLPNISEIEGQRRDGLLPKNDTR